MSVGNSDFKIGICLITKNCNKQYLEEFIEWHKLIGVNYFFIYDNESDTPINTFINDENIYIMDINGRGKQLDAYNDCVNKHNNGVLPNCDWIAFIDDDEFIVPENGNIKLTLKNYSNYSGVGINWLFFGSSGLKNKTNEKQIFKFNKTLPYKNNVNKHIKTIAKPQEINHFITPHCCSYKSGGCVDINKNIVGGSFTLTPIHNIMWLNRYFCRSEEEFKVKIDRGLADHKDSNIKRKMGEFYLYDSLSINEDNKIKELYIKLTT